MKLRIAILVLAVVGCKKRLPNAEPIGAKCEYDSNCKSYVCSAGKCIAGPTENQPCTPNLICGENLLCAPTKLCVPADRYDEQKQIAEHAKEQALLAQSGVVTDGGQPAEQVAYPPGAGAKVRVAKATADKSPFAACRADERLVGGGCLPTVKTTANEVGASYPSAFGEDDTVGARWNCTAVGEVTAFALCAKLQP